MVWLGGVGVGRWMEEGWGGTEEGLPASSTFVGVTDKQPTPAPTRPPTAHRSLLHASTASWVRGGVPGGGGVGRWR